MRKTLFSSTPKLQVKVIIMLILTPTHCLGHKLSRYAELESWTDRQKLLQLELHLVGRAEQTYELLPSESRDTFTKTVESLRKPLHPVQDEALLSAQLMNRKQNIDETVDSYAESLFEKNYRKKLGMDVSSSELLERDLLVQGMLMK